MDSRLNMTIAREHVADQRRAAARAGRLDTMPRAGRATRLSTIALRVAGPGDDAALSRLAQLDSARPPAGEVLLAEVDGQAVAAVSLADGHVVATPMAPTGEARELLALRAAHLAPRPRARRLPWMGARAA
jgi:hypothetical protein